jgi:Mn-dependent DtxR family transcriptional regulator
MGKPNTELTSSEKAAWIAWGKHVTKNGTPPSVRQLAALLEVSPNAAHYTIGKLREKGYLAERQVTETRLMLTSKGKKRRPA